MAAAALALLEPWSVAYAAIRFAVPRRKCGATALSGSCEDGFRAASSECQEPSKKPSTLQLARFFLAWSLSGKITAIAKHLLSCFTWTRTSQPPFRIETPVGRDCLHLQQPTVRGLASKMQTTQP